MAQRATIIEHCPGPCGGLNELAEFGDVECRRRASGWEISVSGSLGEFTAASDETIEAALDCVWSKIRVTQDAIRKGS